MEMLRLEKIKDKTPYASDAYMLCSMCSNFLGIFTWCNVHSNTVTTPTRLGAKSSAKCSPLDQLCRYVISCSVTRQPLVHSRFTRYHASNIGILNHSPSSKSFTREHALTIGNSVVNRRYTHSRVNHRGSLWYIRWWQIR